MTSNFPPNNPITNLLPVDTAAKLKTIKTQRNYENFSLLNPPSPTNPCSSDNYTLPSPNPSQCALAPLSRPAFHPSSTSFGVSIRRAPKIIKVGQKCGEKFAANPGGKHEKDISAWSTPLFLIWMLFRLYRALIDSSDFLLRIRRLRAPP